MLKTLTNQEITTVYESIQSLRQVGTQALPVKIGFTIVKDANLIEPIYKAAISMRDEIALRYGTNDGTGTVNISPEHLETVTKELQDLSECTTEVDLTLIPLAAISDLSLPLDLIYGLYPIIDENGEA